MRFACTTKPNPLSLDRITERRSVVTSMMLSNNVVAVLLLSSSWIASAKLVNRTIDDHYGDAVTGFLPVYEGGWNYGPNCSACLARPEPADTFMASWHDSSASPWNDIVSVTLNFTGTCQLLKLK